MPRREGIQLKLRNAHYWKATKNQTPTLLWFLCLLTYFWILSYFILFLCMCSPFLLFFLHFPKHWVDMGRPSRYQPTARHFDLDRAPQATGADATWRDAGCGCQTSAPQRICRLATEILKMYENVEDLFLENLTEAYGWWFVAFLSIGCIYWIGLNCWASWQIWDSQPGKNRLQKKKPARFVALAALKLAACRLLSCIGGGAGPVCGVATNKNAAGAGCDYKAELWYHITSIIYYYTNYYILLILLYTMYFAE